VYLCTAKAILLPGTRLLGLVFSEKFMSIVDVVEVL